MEQPSSSVPFLERQEIERRASELTSPISKWNASFDAFDIARRKLIPVTFVRFEESDIAGMLVREGDRSEIKVNSSDPYERQNFTVAHELGHLTLCHPGTWKDTKNTMYRRSAWSIDTDERRAEYQANLFAASLLMPESVIQERWRLLRSINYLAPYFRVSKKAMLRRLEELGLIVPSPNGVRFVDLSGWVKGSGDFKPRTLSDDRGPIPRFAPLATDELGRIIPISDAEWAARSSAFTRILRIADKQADGPAE